MIIKTYAEAESYLAGRNVRALPSIRSTRIVCVIPGRISLVYHNTPVVTWSRDGRIFLRSDGHRTVTTKRRMNEFTSAHVFQRNGKWYVNTKDGIRDFVDGMCISLAMPHEFKTVSLPLDD